MQSSRKTNTVDNYHPLAFFFSIFIFKLHRFKRRRSQTKNVPCNGPRLPPSFLYTLPGDKLTLLAVSQAVWWRKKRHLSRDSLIYTVIYKTTTTSRINNLGRSSDRLTRSYSVTGPQTTSVALVYIFYTSPFLSTVNAYINFFFCRILFFFFVSEYACKLEKITPRNCLTT